MLSQLHVCLGSRAGALKFLDSNKISVHPFLPSQHAPGFGSQGLLNVLLPPPTQPAQPSKGTIFVSRGMPAQGPQVLLFPR